MDKPTSNARGNPETLSGDLIVDASGRTSQLPEWLETLGYARPEEVVINSFTGYATRWYELPKHANLPWKGMLIGLRPPDQPRGGVFMMQENGACVITMSGANGEYPPTDEEGFLAFAHRLASPLIYEIMRTAHPITPVYSYRRMENRRRFYERLQHWPDGSAALGDSVCAFNPIYGQGMTVGALEALVLSESLAASGDRQLGLALQKKLAHVIETAWMLATSEDFRWPQTQGERPRVNRLMHRYLEGVLALAPANPKICRTFMGVTHLLEPPSSLFQPTVLLPVLANMLKPKRATHAPAKKGQPSHVESV